MTTRYRVEYALKSHRRDALIEFIKGLLAVPFVLGSRPTGSFDSVQTMTTTLEAKRRYAEIMRDVEELINDHIAHHKAGTLERSKLRLLVPTVGIFFTPLELERAFFIQDDRRAMSSRRFVAPSFNDIRLILNTAQILSLVRGSLRLITFDGDVTLYDDGQSLSQQNPVIPRILNLLKRGMYIGVVTAAGYTDASRYTERLFGLLFAIKNSNELSVNQKSNLIVLGGESSYLYRSSPSSPEMLEFVPFNEWALDEMKAWKESDVAQLLDLAEDSLKSSMAIMRLKAQVIRKERAVGIVPAAGCKFTREQLEEAVLGVQKTLELSEVGRRLPFCAFNGGNDVFVDIGDKRYGVMSCQSYFNNIAGAETLHVGDQFLGVGGNDFKARLACTTVWISNPQETVESLDELTALLDELGKAALQVEAKNRGLLK